jgi:hypothetical protein
MISFKRAPEPLIIDNPDNKRLWDEFSKDEKKKIERSKRARSIILIEGKSCAEKVLLSTVRSFGRPDEMACFAASFGGGIQRYDLCGMLTGSFMSIGLAGDVLYENEEERSEFVRKATREHWDWWESYAPIHCHELRPRYSWDPEGYNRMLQRVALRLDELFAMDVKS